MPIMEVLIIVLSYLFCMDTARGCSISNTRSIDTATKEYLFEGYNSSVLCSYSNVMAMTGWTPTAVS